jgi:TPR repeat protein
MRTEIEDVCCADCGSEAGGGVSLKACTACRLVKYCNAECQRNHWPKHKKECKQRAAEIRDEALFKDPPAKEECPICFLPMPFKLISCMTLPPATIMSVPINDFANANELLAKLCTEQYYSCCGKSICGGCVYSFSKSDNGEKCPFCNAERMSKTDEDRVEEMMKRVEVNDAGAMTVMGSYYYHGKLGLLQDWEKALELWKQAAKLGSSQAHYLLGYDYRQRGDSKKAKFHYEAAAMAGHDGARFILANMEFDSGNVEQAVKHWIIAASAGSYHAMNTMRKLFENGLVSRESIDSTLTTYNNSCAEMRSEARDKYMSDLKGEWR